MQRLLSKSSATPGGTKNINTALYKISMEISPVFDSRVVAKKNFLQSIAGTRKGESLWSFGVFVVIKLMSLFCPALSLIDIAFDHHLYT